MHRLIELVILIFQFVQVECQCSYSALGHADYIGCFVDSDPIRKFPYVYGGIHFVNMTIDFCILGCADDGFKYAGMQSRQWCHCGNDPYSDLAIHPNVSNSECSTPCYGNLSQMCGGEWRLSIYRIRKVLSTPTFQQYGTAFYGKKISTQPTKSQVIYTTGIKAKVYCARVCGETIDCKLFSFSSQSKFCSLFENTINLCEANIMDPNTSIHLLL
ncbi:sialate:O-sulfotransferase 2-like [Mytilus edulis]|uniref:sialate:O-sulfotransferase 2-like n=1 Tax=Mytilus edulis TaxID=6550 RepID=UPI0039EED0F4